MGNISGVFITNSKFDGVPLANISIIRPGALYIDADNDYLVYAGREDGTLRPVGGGGGSSPGGSNTQMQYNNNGVFAGASGVSYNRVSNSLNVASLNTSNANLGSINSINILGGTTGQVLTTNGSGNLSWTNISPAGTNTELQFNDNGVFGADSTLGFDKTNKILSSQKLGGTLITAAQPNITSLGTLSGLTVAGTINATTINANISGSNVVGNVASANSAGVVVNASQPNITSLGTLSNLSINGVANLGNVANVKIIGGNNGQVLATDGFGNLTFTTVSGGSGGSPAGLNTQIQFNNNGAFGASVDLTYANNILEVNGQVNPYSVKLQDRNIIFTIYSVTYGNGQYIAMGQLLYNQSVGLDDCYILRSSDGITWSAKITDLNDPNDPFTIYGVTYLSSASLFVCCGTLGSIYTSSNGINWTNRITDSGTQSDLFGIIVFGNILVMVGENGVILTSSNGTSWTTRTSGTTQTLSGVVASNNVIVAVGNSGTVLTSTNGTTWVSIPSLPVDYLESITYSSALDLFVTVGSNGAIFTSADGTTWISRTSGTTRPLYGVANGANMIVACGEDGVLATSSNGTDWVVNTLLTTQTLRSADYNNGVFTIVGDNGVIFTSPDGIVWTSPFSFSGDGSGLTNVAALTANTVINPAQPNITSLGTLGNLNVNGLANLGNIANIKIAGGYSGNLLMTDGLGNLSWNGDYVLASPRDYYTGSDETIGPLSIGTQTQPFELVAAGNTVVTMQPEESESIYDCPSLYLDVNYPVDYFTTQGVDNQGYKYLAFKQPLPATSYNVYIAPPSNALPSVFTTITLGSAYTPLVGFSVHQQGGGFLTMANPVSNTYRLIYQDNNGNYYDTENIQLSPLGSVAFTISSVAISNSHFFMIINPTIGGIFTGGYGLVRYDVTLTGSGITGVMTLSNPLSYGLTLQQNAHSICPSFDGGAWGINNTGGLQYFPAPTSATGNAIGQLATKLGFVQVPSGENQQQVNICINTVNGVNIVSATAGKKTLASISNPGIASNPTHITGTITNWEVPAEINQLYGGGFRQDGGLVMYGYTVNPVVASELVVIDFLQLTTKIPLRANAGLANVTGSIIPAYSPLIVSTSGMGFDSLRTAFIRFGEVSNTVSGGAGGGGNWLFRVGDQDGGGGRTVTGSLKTEYNTIEGLLLPTTGGTQFTVAPGIYRMKVQTAMRPQPQTGISPQYERFIVNFGISDTVLGSGYPFEVYLCGDRVSSPSGQPGSVTDLMVIYGEQRMTLTTTTSFYITRYTSSGMLVTFDINGSWIEIIREG